MDKTKILIVDDQPENIKVLSHLLEPEDIEIFSATGGEEALGLLLEHEFALALLDVQMPKMSGFELARLIRGVKKHSTLPIIFVTAHQRDQSVVLEGYDTGAVDLLFKPLDPHVVRSKVHVFVQPDRQSKQLKEQMRELEQLRVQAESANIAKSRFLANMSHEIRTPLAAVMGFSDIMSQPGVGETERAEYSKAIRRNGELLLKLIDEILDLSKIESQRVQLEEVDFDLNELIADLRSTLALKASEKGLNLEIDSHPRLTTHYRSDFVRLKQILLNVVGNAIKFTENGRIKVSIESGQAGENRSRLIFRMSDTGIGLEAAQIEKLFKPFSQADASTKRLYGGSGLGLVISRQFARAMGGDLILEKSAPGEGSTFLLTILAKNVETKTAAIDAPSPTGAPESLDLRGKRILMVDDILDNRILLQHYLKATGATLVPLESGELALKDAEKSVVDLILMDIQMPGMDGYETTEKLRQRGFLGPIIALTAHATQKEHDRCLEAGCDQVLTKPLARTQLFDTLAKIFGLDPEVAAPL